MNRAPWLRLAPVLLAWLPACGGSASGKLHFLTLVANLAAEGPIEGTRDPTNNIVETNAGLEVGDREGQTFVGPIRAFLSFDLGPIPANATIVSAVLQCHMVAVSGIPFDPGPTGLGNLMVDQVSYGSTFPDASSFFGNTVLGNLAVLSSDASLGIKSATVTFGVNNDFVAQRPRTQFRLKFSNRDQNFDAQQTKVRLVDAEDVLAQGTSPVLTITYTIPN